MRVAMVHCANAFNLENSMPNGKNFFSGLLMAGLCLWLAISTVAAQNPGTPADPLVSKSYIDHLLRFRSVVLPANSQIKPEPGAMLVIRSGQMHLEVPKGKSVIDLTAGKEISGGNDLPLNHLIIIPDSGDYVLKAKKLTLLLASYLQEEKER